MSYHRKKGVSVTYAPKLGKRHAAAIVVALAALALVASAGATPKKTKFVSKRYHYSLVLPGGPVLPSGSGRWLTAHATRNWSGNDTPSLSNAAFDNFADEKTGHTWVIGAKRVPKGMTLAKWTAYTAARLNPNCSQLAWHSSAKLGGAPARRYDVKCPEGRGIVLAALHAHRGYVFNCIPGTVSRLATQRACNAVDRTFHYTSG